MAELKEITQEYVYITVPREYICVYHKILLMLKDYGVELLKDCKAKCSKRNIEIIECFNMFNSAVAARKLGDTKLAELLINYIKAKMNQIFCGANDNTKFIFPIDADGNIKAFVSCGEPNKMEVDTKDWALYSYSQYSKSLGNNYETEFTITPEGYLEEKDVINPIKLIIQPYKNGNDLHLKASIVCMAIVDGKQIKITDQNATIHWYLNGDRIDTFNFVNFPDGNYTLSVVVKHAQKTYVQSRNFKIVNNGFLY